SDIIKERTFATLVSALDGLLPIQDASHARDTPPHQSQPAAFDAQFPPLPRTTHSHPAHLPTRPTVTVLNAQDTLPQAPIRPVAASPDLETRDKLASQIVLSVNSLPAADRDRFNVPDAALTGLVQGALGSTQAVLKSARRLRLSGDLLLKFSSAAYAAAATSAAPTWLYRLHSSHTIATPLRLHGIVFHAVPSGLNEVYLKGAVQDLVACEVVEVRKFRSRKEGALAGSVRVVMR
ncbi:hypothetical protein JCM11641_002175, partial [Rhodosporidiobolus odoratus]